MNNIIRETWPRIRAVIRNDTTYYIVDCRTTKFPELKEKGFSTQADAIDYHDAMKRSLETGNMVNDAERSLWRRYKSLYLMLPELKGDEKLVLERMERQLERGLTNADSKEKREEKIYTNSELADLYLAAKKRGDGRLMRDASIKEIGYLCKIIKSRWGKYKYETIKKTDISAYLKELKSEGKADITIKHMKVRLGSFFTWVVDEGFGRGNPAKHVKWVVGFRDRPRLLSVEQATDLIRKAEQDFKPLIHFVVLGLMAGVRPTEISRLSWSDIKIYDQPFVVEKGYLIYGTIEIKTKTSKTGRHRQVWINESAAEFLKKYKDYPIYEKVNFRKEWDKLRVAAGWNVNPVVGDEKNWEPDFLRHTWTSFNVAKTQDWELTASQAGNSVEVLRTYYVSTTDPRDVNKYFGIRPLE